MPIRFTFFALSSALLALCLAANDPASPADQEKSAKKRQAAKTSSEQVQAIPQSEQQLFSGRVVMLRAALARKGILSAEEVEKQVVLETTDGDLIPIVPDWRGRAFYQDKRLRDRKVDLIGHRKKGVPYLQVLMVFTFDKAGKRQYTDYWCDVCAIPMYEVKPCECCQQETRLRYQPQNLPAYVVRKSTQPAGPSAAETAR